MRVVRYDLLLARASVTTTHAPRPCAPAIHRCASPPTPARVSPARGMAVATRALALLLLCAACVAKAPGTTRTAALTVPRRAAAAADDVDTTLLPPVVWPLPLGAVKPLGWLDTQLRIQKSGLAGHLSRFWTDVANSTWVGGDANENNGLREVRARRCRGKHAPRTRVACRVCRDFCCTIVLHASIDCLGLAGASASQRTPRTVTSARSRTLRRRRHLRSVSLTGSTARCRSRTCWTTTRQTTR